MTHVPILLQASQLKYCSCLAGKACACKDTLLPLQGHTEVCVCTCQQVYQLSKLAELCSTREVFRLRLYSDYVRGWSQQATLIMRPKGMCE